MTHSCPISLRRIDTNMVRLISLQVLITASFLLVTEQILFSLILLFDFVVRAFHLKKISPFMLISRIIINTFHLQPEFCDEAPKRFALYLGLAIIGFFTLLLYFGFSNSAMLMISILMLCALLELLFDYCIGCKIYQYLNYIYKRK